MALKATAWRRVLIAQFEEYFDDALQPENPRLSPVPVTDGALPVGLICLRLAKN